MARSAAGKAEQAADALEAFLRDRPLAASFGRETNASLGAPAVGGGATSESAPTRAGEGGASKPASLRAGAPLRLPHTDWLRHRLVVTGLAAGVNGVRRAAAGAGTIPWRLELDSLEEDWFHLLVNPANRSLSLTGARVLAGQLREALERRHAIAGARVGRSRACPFDLHANGTIRAGRVGDITALLRACLAAIRLSPEADGLFRVPGPPFWSMSDTAERFRTMLPLIGEGGAPLVSFLPEIPVDALERELRCRVAVAGTFLAGLELTRDGCIAVQQETAWASVQVRGGQGLTSS